MSLMKGENVDDLPRIAVFVCEAPVRCLSTNLTLVSYVEAAVSKVNANQQLAVGMKTIAEGLLRQLLNERAHVISMYAPEKRMEVLVAVIVRIEPRQMHHLAFSACAPFSQ
jgi:hypothetical protein